MLMMSLVPPLFAEVGSITYTATYSPGNLSLGTDTLGGVTYTTVSYGDLSNGGQPGAPSLPVDYLRFSVPANAANFTVTASRSMSLTQNINHLVYPCQQPRLFSDTSAWVINPPNSSIYNSGYSYPSLSACAWVADEGFLAGENHIITVALMPVTFRNRSLPLGMRQPELSLPFSITITLQYELSDSLAMYPIVRGDMALRNEGYRLVQSMVVNPGSVAAFAPMQSPTDTLYRPYHAPAFNTGLPKFPYLIITTQELSHSLRRLVALKRQKGYNVKLATLDDIMADPYAQYGDVVNVNGTPTVTFTDGAGIIREYLKLAYYFNTPKYLLLAGTDVPYRKVFSIGDSVPTDLYYSDLTGNWYDGMDKCPELFVGRILAKTESQIDNYTDKLLRYELNPGKGDYSYLGRALYTESIDMLNLSKLIGKGMNCICPDSTLIQEHRGQKYPKASNIVDTINSTHYGFWSTFNHGEPSCIVTYGMRWPKAYENLRRLWAIDTVHIARSTLPVLISDRGLNNIENKDYPMISYSISCKTMPFDNYSSFYADLPMNFGESFTTGKDYGGPAYLGNTRDGYSVPSATLAKAFGEAMCQGYFKIGEAEAISKTKFEYKDYDEYIPLTHNLLGDPELDMWSDLPQQYSNIGITRTNNTVSISGIDADSTIVAYYANDGQIGTDTISTDSIKLSGISPNSTIMLYKHNYIPYIAPVLLQNISLSNSQYVIASDVTAGNSIDSGRTNGDVIVPDGVEYEIEASGKVTLSDGFRVEQGATFAVYPSSF